MRAAGFMFALFGFLGLVGAVPIWQHFVGPRASAYPLEVQFLAAMSLPATIAIFLASQLGPGGG